MQTFDEIYQKVEECSHETAFSRGEALALYGLITAAEPTGTLVEIGVQFGRSATVFCELQKEFNYNLILIDGWVEEEYSNSARNHFLNQTEKHGWKYTPIWINSNDAVKKLIEDNVQIDIIHIDGDHEYEGVKDDILNYTPLVVSGGFIVFDDYGHESLPGVYQACSEFMTEDKFEFIGRYDNKLGVYRKK